MKSLKFMTAALIGGMFMFTSCDKNDDFNQNGISSEIIKAFNKEFPNAENVKWNRSGAYEVATFELSGTRAGFDADNTAWFELSSSLFVMDEHDAPFSSLPQAVRTAFDNSKYASWEHDDDVDVIRRLDKSADPYKLYVIEVEQGEQEYDLYFEETGVLVKEVPDAYGDNDFTELLPSKPAGNVYKWLEENYPGARVIDLDNEDGGIEVEFLYKGIKHEALLTMSNDWIYTKLDYNQDLNKLPESIKNYIKGDYASYIIDDIEYYESTKEGNFYCVEIESETLDRDMELCFNENGDVIEKPDFSKYIEQGGGITVDADIQKVLDEEYPGAIVTETDYDDGMLEIEIRHDGVEKDVYFNGRKQWVKTEYDLEEKDLPAVINNAIRSKYPSFRIDDIEVIETSSVTVYEVEIENGGRERKLIIDENGKIIKDIADL